MRGQGERSLGRPLLSDFPGKIADDQNFAPPSDPPSFSPELKQGGRPELIPIPFLRSHRILLRTKAAPA